MADTVIEAAVRGLPYVNADDEAMAFESWSHLSKERRAIVATAFPDCGASAPHVVAVICSKEGAKREFVARFKDGEAELVMGSCGITFEDITPSECVEFAFAEAPTQWALAQISLDALEQYRGMKFDMWKKMLLTGDCEAQLRRMLKIGVVSRLYDAQVFPTPETLKSSYQVTDDRNGKLITLPHPVHELRVWDSTKQAYQALSPHLTGAPPDAENAAWWQAFLTELRQTRGEEYVNDLLGGV